MNCENLYFSQKLSEQRIAQANAILGTNTVRKILGYALFLLGVDRSAISSLLNMPVGTIRSLVRVMSQRGLSAFEDQRAKTSSFKPPAPAHSTPASLLTEAGSLKVDFGSGDHLLEISNSNPEQKRVVLLSLLNSDILSRSQVANAIGLSLDRVGKVAAKLRLKDAGALFDQRHGQRQEYRFTPEVKSELIQQFVIDIVDKGHTSGEQLAENLRKRCSLELSPRTILHHFSGLGLSLIKKSLPENLAELKKNFCSS